MGQRIQIFDTTLRDGEQSPGFSMRLDEKLQMARQLERLGVDVIEAGFPASSPSDFASVHEIAQRIRTPVICGLARAAKADIEKAYAALKHAARPRIHTFIATSSIHMEKKLNLKPHEVVQRATEAVAFAKSLGVQVQFALEDCLRSDPSFAAAVCQAVADAGATIINVPDTVGYTSPSEMAELIRYLIAHVQAPGELVWSAHCHNDLGLAVANSLAAIEAGCTQVECTINGIGERAGNAALEELVMMIRTRNDRYPYDSGIRSEELYPTSKVLQSITGIAVQPNKAIVGANAFAHEAGIHQDGMLKDRTTYEIMRPEDVGLPETVLVLGKHSGRRALRDKLQRMGYQPDDSRLDELFERFKTLADTKKYVADSDLEALVSEDFRASERELVSLRSFQVMCGSSAMPTATVQVSVGKSESRTEAASGTGAVEAIFRAIDRALGFNGELADYQVRALTGGRDGAAEVSVRLGWDGHFAPGRGISSDVLEASARAYISALNHLVLVRHPTRDVAASEDWLHRIFSD